MKKWIALLLAVIMCLSLCACGEDSNHSKPSTEPTESGVSNDSSGETDDNADDDADDTAGSTTDTDWLVDGWIVNAVKLRNDVRIAELTTENWKEHFKVYHYTYSYDEEKIEYDTFGDVVSTETITHSGEGYAFGAGNEKYHWYDTVAIELKDKTSGELTIYEFGLNHPDDMLLDEEFDISNYECTRIKGSIYYWDYPIGTFPVETMLSPFEGSEDGMPYPLGFKACAGTNAISYAEMSWII